MRSAALLCVTLAAAFAVAAASPRQTGLASLKRRHVPMYDQVTSLQEEGARNTGARAGEVHEALFARKQHLRTGDPVVDARLVSGPQTVSQQHSQTASSEARARQRRGSDKNNRCGTSSSDSKLDAGKIRVGTHNFPSDAAEIAFLWIGQPRGEIVALVTREQERHAPNLYCSSDFGRNYTLCSGINAPIVQLRRVETRDATWVFALPSPSQSQYYTKSDFDSAAGFYLSTDNGRNFQFKPTDKHFHSILPNPNNAHEMLAFIPDDDHSDYEVDDVFHVSGYGSGQAQVLLASEHVFYADWSTADAAGSTDDVLLTVYRREPGEVVPLDLLRLQRPGDAESKTKTLRKNCYDFHQEAGFLFATEVPSSDGFDERRLFVSRDNGDSFDEAEFPFAARHNHFKIVDASEGVVFALVEHTVTRTEGDTFVFRVDSPESVAGNYTASKGLFTPVLENNVLSGTLFIEKQNPLGCSDRGGVSPEAEGLIAVVRRGECKFTEKTLNAQAAGAIGVVIINDADDISFRMSGEEGLEIDIPAFMITESTGNVLEQFYDDEGIDIVVSLIEDNVSEKKIMQTSNLFVSDESGVKFTLSLSDVAYIPEFSTTGTEVADVHKVASQPGTYLATWLKNDRMETVITFNKGASWSHIPPPEGARCAAGGDEAGCQLHIALDAARAVTELPLPMSTPTASGVILANGYAGESMTFASAEANLYLSTDGGLTWTFAAESPHEYQILDHGGVLVAAPYFHLTDSILYTVDYGATEWEKKKVATDDSILQLTAETGGGTLVVYAYFYDKEWRGAAVDFEPLLGRPCSTSGIGSANADYEIFTPGLPTADGEHKCLLGAEHKYLRRIDCRICFNGLDHEPKFEREEDKGSTPCECSAVDFACAPGFARKSDLSASSPCEYDKAYKKEIDCSGRKGLEQVRNYAKVVGDMCSGGEESAFQETVGVKCNNPGTDRAMVVVSVVVVVALLVILITASLYKSPSLRQKVSGGLARVCCMRPAATVSFSQLHSTTDIKDDLMDSDDEMLIGTGDADPQS